MTRVEGHWSFYCLQALIIDAMSIVDSEAVFRSRGLLIGVTEDVLNMFKDSGISSMGKLAFASAYVPGAAEDAPFTELVKQALKRDPTLGELAALRRLFSESYAATAAEMKSIVEQTDETPARRLAPAEFETQQKRLTGIKISGLLEPGDSLVDAAVAIYEYTLSGNTAYHVNMKF